MVVVNVKNNKYTVSDLYQWDTNRRLDIFGLNLPSLPEIHFANGKMANAIVKRASWNDNGGITVKIPNVVLETPSPITVYVCCYEGEEFITRYSFVIKLKARTKPEDYFAEDEEKIYSYNALENLVLNTVTELRDEVTNIVKNAKITDSDTVDGFHAKDFVLADRPGKTVFNLDGSITTTYNDGSTEKVVFNQDGSITTTSNTLGLGVRTEVTKFNADGSITVEVTVEEVTE